MKKLLFLLLAVVLLGVGCSNDKITDETRKKEMSIEKELLVVVKGIGFVDKEIEIWCSEEDFGMQYIEFKKIKCNTKQNFKKTIVDGKEYYTEVLRTLPGHLIAFPVEPPTLYPIEDYQKFKLVPVK